ncbi:MAG: diadenylate cyclase CdaA [bacterium]
MSEFWALISTIQLTDVLDILIVSAIFYTLFSVLRETRSSVALRGLIAILVSSFLIFLIARALKLRALELMFERFWVVIVLVFLIVFQNELKKALTDIGQLRIFRHLFEKRGRWVDEIAKAVVDMSGQRVGALIAIERRNPLRAYVDTGTRLDSLITTEMIRTIFTDLTPLHDGAMMISNDRITAAACILPLTADPTIGKELGTRHRAAIGLSEETDAVVIVVSEETGIISVALNGRLERHFTAETLKARIEKVLELEPEEETREAEA